MHMAPVLIGMLWLIQKALQAETPHITSVRMSKAKVLEIEKVKM